MSSNKLQKHLKCGILKYVVTAAVMLVTTFILEFVRYSDNILFSFQTLEEFNQVKKDMEESFAKYSIPLKYLITSVYLHFVVATTWERDIKDTIRPLKDGGKMV